MFACQYVYVCVFIFRDPPGHIINGCMSQPTPSLLTPRIPFRPSPPRLSSSYTHTLVAHRTPLLHSSHFYHRRGGGHEEARHHPAQVPPGPQQARAPRGGFDGAVDRSCRRMTDDARQGVGALRQVIVHCSRSILTRPCNDTLMTTTGDPPQVHRHLLQAGPRPLPDGRCVHLYVLYPILSCPACVCLCVCGSLPDGRYVPPYILSCADIPISACVWLSDGCVALP